MNRQLSDLGSAARYRISSTSESDWDVWEVAAKDCSQAFAVCVQVLNRPNFHSRFVKIRGLDEKCRLNFKKLRTAH